MSLRLCILGSGSSGNCIYVDDGETAILIDAGLSGRVIEQHLAAVGADPSRLKGVCVTHEHDDHRMALGVLHRRFGVPLYANSGTIQAIEGKSRDEKPLAWNVFTTGSPFAVGELEVHPFSVPHDSYDPVGFVVRKGEDRIGIVTDIGMPTEVVRRHLRGCEILVLESNHDEDLLREADRPWSLKQRIAGRQGHLSNRQAGELVCEVATPALRLVYLAHLSSDCNRPELALRTVVRQLEAAKLGHVTVRLAYPDRPSEPAECLGCVGAAAAVGG